jgi:hypothetical protein
LNVSESWKKILDLPLTLCESQQVNYVGNMNSITDGITNGFFCRWYAIIVNEITDWMVPIIFFIYKSIDDYITEGMTNKIKITDNIFFDDQSMILLVDVFST